MVVVVVVVWCDGGVRGVVVMMYQGELRVNITLQRTTRKVGWECGWWVWVWWGWGWWGWVWWGWVGVRHLEAHNTRMSGNGLMLSREFFQTTNDEEIQSFLIALHRCHEFVHTMFVDKLWWQWW